MSAYERVIDLPGGVRVLFTQRRDGNLSSTAGPDAESALHVREALRECLVLRALARGYQVHGCDVRRVREPPGHESPGPPANREDGQATALARVGVMVLAADCLPVALGAPGAVAMLHAGWRGIAAGILEQGVRAMAELAPGAAVHAALGPCAGACCYEVGEEVHAALGSPRGEGHIDLRVIARQRLLGAGVADVLDAGGCTICDERYFSHRREGSRAGRQAGVAWLS